MIYTHTHNTTQHKHAGIYPVNLLPPCKKKKKIQYIPVTPLFGPPVSISEKNVTYCLPAARFFPMSAIPEQAVLGECEKESRVWAEVEVGAVKGEWEGEAVERACWCKALEEWLEDAVHALHEALLQQFKDKHLASHVYSFYHTCFLSSDDGLSKGSKSCIKLGITWSSLSISTTLFMTLGLYDAVDA